MPVSVQAGGNAEGAALVGAGIELVQTVSIPGFIPQAASGVAVAVGQLRAASCVVAAAVDALSVRIGIDGIASGSGLGIIGSPGGAGGLVKPAVGNVVIDKLLAVTGRERRYR